MRVLNRFEDDVRTAESQSSLERCLGKRLNQWLRTLKQIERDEFHLFVSRGIVEPQDHGLGGFIKCGAGRQVLCGFSFYLKYRFAFYDVTENRTRVSMQSSLLFWFEDDLANIDRGYVLVVESSREKLPAVDGSLTHDDWM
jgi:hypothetical protein